MTTGAAVNILDIAEQARTRGLGELCVRREGKRARLPLAAVNISARAADRVAEVTVRQTFKNPLAEALEAVYTFPLSGAAAVRRFELRVAGKTLAAVLDERGKARETYQKAIEAGKRAALLEQDRSDVFTLQVGNLPPGEEAEVTIVYSEALPYFEDGTAELRLPLVVAPRYIPGAPLEREQAGLGVKWDTDRVPDASRITPPRLAPGFDPKVALSIEVELPAGGIEDLACSQHAVSLSAGKIALVRQDELLDRDFLLRWRLASDAVKPSLLVTKDGYAMLTLAAPRQEGFSGVPRDVVFLLDRSGSMGGIKMGSATRACSLLLATLGPKDRFGICAFDDRTEWFRKGLVAADEAGINDGDAYLRTISERGGTNLGPGLAEALKAIDDRGEEARAGVVVIVTDGQVGQESEILMLLEKKLGDARVFTVGIDTAVNEGFLRKLAALGGGTCSTCAPGASLEVALRGIGREIGEPLVTDLAIDGAKDLAPEGLGDLFAGRAATLFFKAAGAVRVTGRCQDGSAFKAKVEPKPVDLPAIEHLWARARISDLEDRFRMGEDVRKEIVRVSLKHSVLCRFTAFAVVDERELNLKPEERRTVVQPVHMPAQWDMHEEVACMAAGSAQFNLTAACMSVKDVGDASAPSPSFMARSLRSIPAPRKIEKQPQGVCLPQADREAVRERVEALSDQLEKAWKEVEAGRLPSPASIESARKALLKALAGSELGAMSPELQRLLRGGLLQLVAALRVRGAAVAKIRPMLERCRSSLAKVLEPKGKTRFWEASI